MRGKERERERHTTKTKKIFQKKIFKKKKIPPKYRIRNASSPESRA